MLQETKVIPGKRFKLKNFGESLTILGMYILRKLNRGLLQLWRERFALRVLERSGMNDAKGHHNLMALNIIWYDKLEAFDVLYHEAVGLHMYLAVGGRRDTAHALAILVKVVEKQCAIH